MSDSSSSPAPKPSRPPFVYQALQHPDEIRLIKLDATSRFRIKIEHRVLRDNPLYTAVSYRWGTNGTTRLVDVDGHDLYVRDSLVDMLGDLIDPEYPRYLWVDAICINQDSTYERNHQVRLMGQIYSRASSVVAYLGSSRWKRFMAGMSSGSTRTIARDLLTNKYFTRRWIIQEFCLARSLVFDMDGYEFTADMLEYALQLYPSAPFSRQAGALIRQRNEMARERPSLEYLLYQHKGAACSRFQDIVFALLATSHRAAQHLSVDYNLSRTDLLVSVLWVSAVHEALPDLCIVGFASFLLRLLQIPPAELRSSVHSVDSAKDHTFHASAVVRGVVTTVRLSNEHDTIFRRLRQHFQPIIHYPLIPLDTVLTASDATPLFLPDSRSLNIAGDPSAGFVVNPYDLWAFDVSPDRNDASTSNVCLGLSTTMMQVGDEVWQFPATRLALIVRQIAGRSVIVGRARLLSDNQICNKGKTTDRFSSLPDLADGFGFIPRDDRNPRGPQRKLALKPRQLVQLMCLVSKSRENWLSTSLKPESVALEDERHDAVLD